MRGLLGRQKFRRSKSVRVILYLTMFLLSLSPLVAPNSGESQTGAGPVMIAEIDGPISPATDDFLKSSLKRATERGARLLIIRLNTPGGLVSSMQSMVQQLLASPVPVAVFVAPQGSSATSAGVFITLAANIAAMAPGTTIGAAHPVNSNGGDIQGDMREKIENFAVSLIRAAAEQRGRNADWAEKAVRESISVTDRDAVAEKVVDLVADDTDQLLVKLEGRTVTINGQPVTLTGLVQAPREPIEQGLRYNVVAFFTDPTVAVLLSIGAMVGLGIELYHPGAVLPAVVGLICLVLSLIAGQVLPINFGGVALLLLGAVFFVIELMAPSFGVWGGAGLICLVLGSIYFVDTDQIWGGDYGVNRGVVGAIAALAGTVLVAASIFVARTMKSRVTTGQEGLIGQHGVFRSGFGLTPDSTSETGKITIRGEVWHARVKSGVAGFAVGDKAEVLAVEEGMVLLVEPVGRR